MTGTFGFDDPAGGIKHFLAGFGLSAHGETIQYVLYSYEDRSSDFDATNRLCGTRLLIETRAMHCVSTVTKALALLGLLALGLPCRCLARDVALSAADCSMLIDGQRIELKGKVAYTASFPDLKVKVVSSFPTLKVKTVEAFPDDCGEWQVVDSFPDFTVQFVDSFPDLEIEFVESFPGLR
ncbi:MAG: hypothetical protein R3F04_13765 [Lysobacteraceae bacterium]